MQRGRDRAVLFRFPGSAGIPAGLSGSIGGRRRPPAHSDTGVASTASASREDMQNHLRVPHTQGLAPKFLIGQGDRS